jgi:hypothetical protein
MQRNAHTTLIELPMVNYGMLYSTGYVAHLHE